MLERERGVVQNEKRQGENQPYGRVFQRMVESMYPASHPYSWSTIGSMEDLDAATMLDDIKDLVRRPTTARTTACSRSPATSRRERARAGEEVLRRHPARSAARALRSLGAAPRARPPRHHAGPRAAGARLPRLARAARGAIASWRSSSLAAGVLSGSKSARLDRRLIYETQLATEVRRVRRRRARSPDAHRLRPP